VEEREKSLYIPVRQNMKIPFILLAILFLVGIATAQAGVAPQLCADVTTDNVTSITPDSAVFQGSFSGSTPALVWFMYGGASNTYAYTTPKLNLTSGTTFSAVAKNGFYSNRTIYLRAGSTCGFGSEISFNVTNASVVMETDFGANMQSIMYNTANPAPVEGTGATDPGSSAGPLDAGVLAGEIPKAYYQSFGLNAQMGLLVFWGFIIMIIFVVLYIRSENVTTPALLGMTIGWVVMSYVPNEWAMAGEALLVVSIAAMGFMIVKGRIR
jgi:hypothetical protein